ncbi:MAG: META domain-containing protein [Cyclobacteriaceae bacterium]
MSSFDHLTNKKWNLSGIPDISDWQNEFKAEIPYIEFDDGGGVSGSTGCNIFHGDFSLTDTGIMIDPGAMTRKMCPGNGESIFMDKLNTANAFEVDEQKLTLLNGTEALLEFSR